MRKCRADLGFCDWLSIGVRQRLGMTRVALEGCELGGKVNLKELIDKLRARLVNVWVIHQNQAT